MLGEVLSLGDLILRPGNFKFGLPPLRIGQALGALGSKRFLVDFQLSLSDLLLFDLQNLLGLKMKILRSFVRTLLDIWKGRLQLFFQLLSKFMMRGLLLPSRLGLLYLLRLVFLLRLPPLLLFLFLLLLRLPLFSILLQLTTLFFFLQMLVLLSTFFIRYPFLLPNSPVLARGLFVRRGRSLGSLFFPRQGQVSPLPLRTSLGLLVRNGGRLFRLLFGDL